jgi:hypothetical protein
MIVCAGPCGQPIKGPFLVCRGCLTAGRWEPPSPQLHGVLGRVRRALVAFRIFIRCRSVTGQSGLDTRSQPDLRGNLGLSPVLQISRRISIIGWPLPGDSRRTSRQACSASTLPRQLRTGCLGPDDRGRLTGADQPRAAGGAGEPTHPLRRKDPGRACGHRTTASLMVWQPGTSGPQALLSGRGFRDGRGDAPDQV